MKYITINLTDDQVRHILSVLHVEMYKLEEEGEINSELHAFVARLIGKLNKSYEQQS